MPNLTCNYCGKTFWSKRPKRCCSPECALKRQLEAIRQMKEKSGVIYDTYVKNITPIRKKRKEVKSIKKRGWKV